MLGYIILNTVSSLLAPKKDRVGERERMAEIKDIRNRKSRQAWLTLSGQNEESNVFSKNKNWDPPKD